MPRLAVTDRRQLRRAAVAGGLAVLAAAAGAVPSKGDLASRYTAGRHRADQLQSTIEAQTSKIEGYRGTIVSLEGRLRVIQRTVAIQERLLGQVRTELGSARARLTVLEQQFARDQKVLAAQLLADYESPPPTIVGVIVARLDALGKALQLHLEGISGYRTPQHSVEVGGFADDPHTRGQASDTPGVEGVPEATLERFCLTRPFGGAAEADHIQLS